MQAPLASRLRIVSACAVCGLLTAGAAGQGGTNAGYRPSEQGALTTLGRTLGNLSREVPVGMSSLPGLNRSVSTFDPSALSSRFRPLGRAGQGYDDLGWRSNAKPVVTAGGSLLGRGGGASAFDFPAASLPSAFNYSGMDRRTPGLLLRRPALAEAPIAAVGIRAPTSSQPAAGASSRAPVPMDELVRDYVESHRKSYLDQGWQKFHDRDYRGSCELFGLAVTVCLDASAPRAEVELGRLFAAIGSRQYTLASNSLRWLITPDRRTSRLPDPDFLTKVVQIRDRYGTKSDFSEQADALELLSSSAKTPVLEVQAIRSIMLLARGDRLGALFAAKRISENPATPAPWTQLHPLMDRWASSADSRAPQTAPAEMLGAEKAPPPVLMPQTVAAQK